MGHRQGSNAQRSPAKDHPTETDELEQRYNGAPTSRTEVLWGTDQKDRGVVGHRPEGQGEVADKRVALAHQERPIADVAVLVQEVLSSSPATIQTSVEPRLAEVKLVHTSVLTANNRTRSRRQSAE